MDLNQLLSRHQISLIRDSDPLNSEAGPSLSCHYAREIRQLRARLGVQSYRPALGQACS